MSTQPRYLVTGGAGFIGSNIVAALTAAGERVRVLDNLSTGRWEHLDGIPQQSHIERIEGDIRDADAVARASRGVEVVFHEAALGSVPRSVERPIESDSVNTNGTVTVLDVARHQGVRRVVFAASSSAYGETPELPKHEGMTPMPLSPYAVTKLACEHYLKVFAGIYGLETVNLRYFNVFGPNQTPDGAYAAAIPRFVEAALSERAIPIYGDGEQTRDFCYVDNAVLANLLAATAPRRFAGEIINVAGGRRIALNALVREISRVVHRELAVDHLAQRPGDIRHSLADISRAKELLGYEPRVRWEDGIQPTVAYLSTLRTQGPAAASTQLTSARVELPKTPTSAAT
ncbi:SDR family oxidoreductase [Chondromyces apiculatus]|uniref:UDP-glucose 4-epimerase n=1 Tax=Chondromyces apiculatus DSM 436 TaxID=1192034 RepID=A0A017TF20_9BACT|nr:SDR family oxidoreductase [Chondromyces apiculatus]EYF07893.1 UDP-glucose 4-epimerase [Chondromyces apiculatus DSM 436]